MVVMPTQSQKKRCRATLPDRLLVLSGLFNFNLKEDKGLSIKLQIISGPEGLLCARQAITIFRFYG